MSLMRRASYILLFAACGAPPPRAPESAIAWEYDVRVEWGASPVVHASAIFHGGGPRLRIDDDAEEFVEDVEVEGRKTALNDAKCTHHPCRVRWSVHLGELARARKDVDVALEAGGAIFSPPSSWLVRPAMAPEGARYRVRVTTSTPIRFAGTTEGSAESLDEPPFAAFGELDVKRVGAIDAVIAARLAVPHDLVATWLDKESGAIGAYLAHAPRGTVFFAPGTQDVTRGKTFGTSILIRVGTTVTPENLLEDWVLAHELLHLSLPGVREMWFAEGLATYVEPIARARAGLISPERVWIDLAEGLPRGRANAASETDRIYWGGAAFFLAADVVAHESGHSLEECLRAAVATGADGDATWPLERFFAPCDAFRRARELDGEKLLASLGVVHDGKKIRLDDKAPKAAIRVAITRP